MLAQLWRLLAVPEAGCLPGDGGGRLNPSAHCAPEGAGLGEGTRLASMWAKATMVILGMASKAGDPPLLQD